MRWNHVDVVDTEVDVLGECPVWDPRIDTLTWVDIDGRRLRRLTSDGRVDDLELPGRPGSLAKTTDPDVVVVAMEHELVRVDVRSGGIEHVVDLDEAGAGRRLNDGRAAPDGSFVVGTMVADLSAGRSEGRLLEVRRTGAELAVDTLAEGIGVPNGLAFDVASGRRYRSDTPTETVWVSEHGGPERVFLDHRDLPGKPDGACTDDSGCYWSASVYGWRVIRVSPDGAIDRVVEVPVEKPSMPCFIGGGRLAVTTIGSGGTVPSAPGSDGFEPGSLFVLDVGIDGPADPITTV